MAQITSGIRAMLSVPVIYDALQNVMGARRVRRELVDEFIRPDAGCRVLDLGCGTADILKFLPNTIEYWGYDISPEYIDAAKATFGTRGHFGCGLLSETDLANLPKFDRVLAIGVLHHLNDEEVQEFFALAKQALNSSGRVVTIDPCLVAEQNPIARFLILRDRGQNVRCSQGYTSLAQENFENVKGTLRHRSWIPYTHWIMECSN
ncbi:MAG TPA: class I SAM-dependent methyltransferase [Nitrosomonas europaea]|uniref:class I SAM-dependent methyltransferase n=1 Tax=Betaproteobacteria TaxID=28216 RepID=UPI002CB2695E|nr:MULTISPECIES: class I SAM-dependent methyltransferase [Betaproteobacteria]HRN82837.1 class I SAM-dependent methyltransferase [Nitrosomonas europaea]HRO22632.1 class I SAM-dependent methyltransferase [Alcaligenes phenolicus]HUM75013.1 class I SAM-dependent methyltransferase [Nitrosomonas europaea]